MLLLLLVLLLDTALIYYANNRDLFSPSFLLSMGYLMSTFFAFLNRNKWYSAISIKTIVVISLSIFVFFIVERTVKRALYHYKNKTIVKISTIPEIGFSKYFIALLIDFISLALILREIIVIGGSNGAWSVIISSYKQEHLSTGVDFSFLGSTAVKIVYSLSFIFLYCFIVHLVNKKIKIQYLAPVLIGLLASILMGNRLILLSYLVFSIVCYGLIKEKYIGIRVRLKLKSMLIFLGLIGISLFAFYKLSDIVGRNTGDSFFDYISVYVGSSIVGLNTYLGEGIVNHQYFFHEILPGMINSLSKIGLTHSVTKILEFRSISSSLYLYSNVYSGLRRMFNSGGFIGIVFFQSVFSFIISELYYSLKYKNYDYVRYGIILVLFGKLCYCVPLQAVEDHFFIDVFSVGYLLEIIITIILFRFVTLSTFGTTVKNIPSTNYASS